MRIDSSGRLGVGTSAPTELLTINGTTPATLIRTSSATGNAQVKFNADNTNYAGIGLENTALVMRCSNSSTPTERARIDSSGSLLVGTSSASGSPRVDIVGNAGNAATEGVLQLRRGSDGLFDGYGLGILKFGDTISGGNARAEIIAYADGTGGTGDLPTRLTFWTTADGASGSTERMRIDNSGRVLINSSTTPSGATLLVRGGPGTTNAAHVQLTHATSPYGGGRISVTQTGGGLEFFTHTGNVGSETYTERMRLDYRGQLSLQSTTSTFDVATTAAAGTAISTIFARHSATNGAPGTGTVSFRVYSNGNVVNTNNSYGAISDIKLKENIVDASSQWDDLKALQVRNYNFKEGQTHTQIGLIAQEVELVSPGLVSESPDRDEEGNDLGTVTKSVNYSVLYMKAVKALQEAMERIEMLEAKVTALEGN
jgi:hypothetical protein